MGIKLLTQRKYKENIKKFTWPHTQTLSFSCDVEDWPKKERKLTTRNGNIPTPPMKSWFEVPN
jgi:hypothetical protein